MSSESPEDAQVRCAECQRALSEGEERVETDDGAIFCTICYQQLVARVHHAVQAQSADISYPTAAVGGIVGGALGALVWWGFTVVTNVAFGLVAIVIGFAVGKGILMATGGKRSTGLQGLSVGIAAVAFTYASYLVNRTFIHKAMTEQGSPMSLPLVPDLELLIEVLRLGAGFMDLVFLAIVLYQAWKIPAPMRLG